MAKCWNKIQPLSPWKIAYCSTWNWIHLRGTLSTWSSTVRASSTFSWTNTISPWVSLTAKTRSRSNKCPFSRPYLTTSRSASCWSNWSWRGYSMRDIIRSLSNNRYHSISESVVFCLSLCTKKKKQQLAMKYIKDLLKIISKIFQNYITPWLIDIQR